MRRRRTNTETLAKKVGQKMLGHDYCDYAIDAFTDAVENSRTHVDLGEYLLEHYPGHEAHGGAYCPPFGAPEMAVMSLVFDFSWDGSENYTFIAFRHRSTRDVVEFYLKLHASDPDRFAEYQSAAKAVARRITNET